MRRSAASSVASSPAASANRFRYSMQLSVVSRRTMDFIAAIEGKFAGEGVQTVDEGTATVVARTSTIFMSFPCFHLSWAPHGDAIIR